MESSAQKTFGVKLKRGSEYIANLISVGEAYAIKVDDIDVTDHDSPDGIKQFIPGLAEISDLPIEGHFIPSKISHIALSQQILKREIEEWTIEHATTPKISITFRGYLNDFKLNEATTEGKLTFSATIKAVDVDDIAVDTSTGLSALVLKDNGNVIDLMPEFSGPGEYFADAGESETVTVTPTAEDHTITVNGAAVPTGVESGPIALTKEVMNTITVKAAETGKAPATYIIKVYREGAI